LVQLIAAVSLLKRIGKRLEDPLVVLFEIVVVVLFEIVVVVLK
jgi:hypothetical protein